VGPPDPAALEALLDAYAPLSPVSLCPEILAFSAQSLVVIWQAAEHVAGEVLPSPFWAFPWPAGIAIARTLLDDPALVRGRAVIDVGAGGGVSSFAAARVGAARVVACDIDPWALAVTRLGAERQELDVETLERDIIADAAPLDAFDVVLCGDLGYDRSAAERERAAIERAVERGAVALIGDAGRTYFDSRGLELVATHTLDVVADLEGTEKKVARVYRLG
jgi:predicted nicotinamide N-methyase